MKYMRQLFVLISLVVLPLSACATIKLGANVGDNLSSDNYRPLLQDGKEWHYRLEMRDEENPHHVPHGFLMLLMVMILIMI